MKAHFLCGDLHLIMIITEGLTCKYSPGIFISWAPLHRLERHKQLGNHSLTKELPPTHPGNERRVIFLSQKCLLVTGTNIHWVAYPHRRALEYQNPQFKKKKNKKILEKRLSMSLHSSPPLPVVRSNNALQLPTCSKKKVQSTQNSTSGDRFDLFFPLQLYGAKTDTWLCVSLRYMT